MDLIVSIFGALDLFNVLLSFEHANIEDQIEEIESNRETEVDNNGRYIRLIIPKNARNDSPQNDHHKPRSSSPNSKPRYRLHAKIVDHGKERQLSQIVKEPQQEPRKQRKPKPNPSLLLALIHNTYQQQ